MLGCCWLSLALLMIGGLAVSILVLFLNSLLSVFFDCRESDSDCDTLLNIGQYLSIACAVLCGLVVICGFSLCCLGCFCQRADEGEVPPITAAPDASMHYLYVVVRKKCAAAQHACVCVHSIVHMHTSSSSRSRFCLISRVHGAVPIICPITC